MIIAFLVSVVTLILSLAFLTNIKGKFKYSFINPIAFVSIFVIFYMIIGFNLFWQGDYYFLGTDLSYGLDRLYRVASVFLGFFLGFFLIFFYSIKQYRISDSNYDYQLRPLLVYFFIFLMLLYSLLIINKIKIPLAHNFLGLFFNAGIVVVSYAVINRMRCSLLLLIVYTFLIVYMGFRYRLLFLFLPIIISIFILKKISFSKLLIYPAITLVAVLIIAIVGVSRRYSDGLDLTRLEGMSFLDIIIQGIFNDTSTVLTSGALIQWLDDTDNFAYFRQIWYMLNYFIPNELYPSKEYSPIFDNISILTGQITNESGAAVLGFVEYYHTAGYYGVILFAFIFGFIFSKFFKRMINSSSIYDHYIYFVLLTWFLNSLTRGYLPQNLQDLVSIIIGLYLIKKFSKLSKVGGYLERTNKRI
ncbi:O-antigen polymerase [Acinetobacter towneri]|uniref:O-antigen polymerase n=1 Tax=Acinetobacter towneri TaxID=202956 RepID=UPI002578C930|nr:O-antigen polymerase [Acinetobacter towneri]MDM1722264.1 oligosaccharide repeat unit polymerase [Acinetobacter towneri]